jgi:integrase
MEATTTTLQGAPRQHVDRASYRRWLSRTATSGVKSNRLRVYDAFVDRWPRLDDWFSAPLAERIMDPAPPAATGPGTAHMAMPYLVYLSLVHGVVLDYDLLIARTFRGPFTTSTYPSGLGVDHVAFKRHQDRLVQLGYARGGVRSLLSWSLGRMLLHRGDPDLAAISTADITELRGALESFAGRPDAKDLRADYARPRGDAPTESGALHFGTALVCLHAAQSVLFHTGQVDQPPPGRRDQQNWANALVPAATPERIAAVVERYLRLKLEASLDRPQTVRHARDALRRLLAWLAGAYPEMETLADLTRRHGEEFLRWLGVQRNTFTGAPLSLTHRRTTITLISSFVNDTASWQWEDVPGRVLFTRADIPKTPMTLPRFLPDHELVALMDAVDRLPDPHQRAALILARWSGARRDEIRRLSLDCLDTYPDGHPRLRIPVGKGHAERSIPLHPDAAAVLQPLIELARRRAALAQFDPSVSRPVRHIFLRRGKLLSTAFLFDLALKAACTEAGLVDSAGRPTVTAHRFRHTIGTQLAEGGARLQTIMAVLGHRTPAMSLIYASLSDPTIKQQYQDALDGRVDVFRLAGPAADELTAHRLDPEAVDWLKTNFLKTELELGHCLRLPAEGPCECDLVLTCSKFVTTREYVPRIRARLVVEQQLIDDATNHGWQREVERHECTRRRLNQLLAELGESPSGTCLLSPPPGQGDLPQSRVSADR